MSEDIRIFRQSVSNICADKIWNRVFSKTNINNKGDGYLSNPFRFLTFNILHVPPKFLKFFKDFSTVIFLENCSENKYKLGSRKRIIHICHEHISHKKGLIKAIVWSDSEARIPVRATPMTAMTHRNLAESLANKADKREIAY